MFAAPQDGARAWGTDDYDHAAARLTPTEIAALDAVLATSGQAHDQRIARLIDHHMHLRPSERSGSVLGFVGAPS